VGTQQREHGKASKAYEPDVSPALRAGDAHGARSGIVRCMGMPRVITRRLFRVATIIGLPPRAVPIGEVQQRAGHAGIRTTRPCDHRRKRATRDTVEQIPT
jgi:hypothetical protein